MTNAQARLATELKWWIDHETLMDYAQSRPVPLAAIKDHRHCATDCSGSLYGIWHALGFQDPTGGEYTSQDIVYTGTLLTANDPVNTPAAGLDVGDLVIFGNTESTVHAAAVLETASDPWLFSHGQDRGPIKIRLSAERAYHASHGAGVVHYRRTSLPADTPPRSPKWRVSIGNGSVLATTRHPRLWTWQHRPFKGHDVVHYRKLDQ